MLHTKIDQDCTLGHINGGDHDLDHMSRDWDLIKDAHGPHVDESRMDATQNKHMSHGMSIIMPNGLITRSQAKKLKQAFQAYVQKWIDEEGKLGSKLETHKRWGLGPLTLWKRQPINLL